MILSQTTPFKRILVIGNSGFIGRHLMKRLELCATELNSEIELIGKALPQLNLADSNSIHDVAEHLGKDTLVFLLAAKKRQSGDTLEAFEENVAIAANFCRADALNPAAHIVFFSSAAVYGEDIHNLSISEQTAVEPRSYYGLAKYTSEGLLRKHLAARMLVLRPATIYGPGDNSAYSPSGFARKALDKECITLWGDGSEQREFIYVTDAVDIAVKLALSGHSGLVNIVSGTSYSFTDILSELEKLGYPTALESKPRSKDKVDNCFDNFYLRKLIPELKFTTLSEGLRKLVAQ